MEQFVLVDIITFRFPLLSVISTRDNKPYDSNRRTLYQLEAVLRASAAFWIFANLIRIEGYVFTWPEKIC